MKSSEQRRIIEALVMASPEPVSAERLSSIVPDLSPASAKDLVNELNTEYQEAGRAFEIWEVAGGFQLRTLVEFSGYLQELKKERPLRLSQAALETLSIIAYKQPVTRSDIEYVRGVTLSSSLLRQLFDKGWIMEEGYKDTLGRPALLHTTPQFLDAFGLTALDELPPMPDLSSTVTST